MDSNSNLRTTDLRARFSWRATLRKRIPICGWLPQYDRMAAVADAIAGTTVGLTMIAQAIAYAALAELPPQYGLYSAFAGSLLYVVLGTVKEVSIGPTSLNALLTLQYTIGQPVEYVVVLAFLTGAVQFAMGALQLGFIVDFISVPVTTAFVSSAAIIIMSAQLKNFIGLSYSSKRFTDAFYELYIRLGQSRPGDMWLSLVCCAFLIAIRLLQMIGWNGETARGRAIKKSLWYLGISSNAILVVSTGFWAYSYAGDEVQPVPFRLSGHVEPGLPAFQWPPFQFQSAHNETIGLGRIAGDLGTGLLVVPLVSLLSNVAIAKAFAMGTSLTVDATQEMMTLGMCNMLGSCFGSMPTGGAFTRSAVIRASGVRTPMVGVYSAACVMLALSVMAPYFFYIPRATLSAVLVIAVVFMIDFRMPIRLWHFQRSDFYAWLLTITVCLGIGIEIGLFAGILLTLGRLVYMWARPNVTRSLETLHSGDQYISVEPATGMFYPCADWLRERTLQAAAAADFRLPIVLQCAGFGGLDYTSGQAVIGLAQDLRREGQVLVLIQLAAELRHFAVPVNVRFVDTLEELERFLRGRREKRLDNTAGQTIELQTVPKISTADDHHVV